jgi:hypothetical protein
MHWKIIAARPNINPALSGCGTDSAAVGSFEL